MEDKIKEILGKQRITIKVNHKPGKSETEIDGLTVAELLALFTQSVEEILGNEKLDLKGKIICDCDCQTAYCNSLYHPCKQPDKHILQAKEAVYQIRNELRAEQRARLATLIKQ